MHENISFCVIENRMQRKRSFRCAICFVIICCAKSSLISPWLSSNDKKKKKNTITRIGLDRTLWKHGRDGGR